MAKGNYEVYETKMKKSIGALKDTFATVRVGKASAAVLDRVTVEYYGTPTPIAQVGTISSPDPKTLVIQPWDGSILKEIEKAILKSELGLTPNNDGKLIRLNFPPLTEERRKELSKQVHKYAEEGKVAIRSIRRDAMEAFKAQKKNGEITEDDLKSAEKDIQDLTDRYIKEVDQVAAEKEKEIMAV